MKKRILIYLTFSIYIILFNCIYAQDEFGSEYVKEYAVGSCVHKNETIPFIKLPTIHIYQPLVFKNKRESDNYNRLVNDVKKTLPLAIEIRDIIIETYEFIQRLPNENAQERHLKELEKGLKEQYTPKMKRLSLRQGKILIKLIDRECNQNAYQLVKLFMGSFKAVFYQSFASIFGASLKKNYDPEREDALLERVVTLVVSGQL